jgi:4-hydroxy-tetrahydrodipicolinate synthase
MTPSSADKLSGLFTAIFTPLDLRGDLALNHFETLLEFQRNAGVDGLVVCGTNGEGTSLSVSEREAALETVIEHNRGGSFAVVAGTGAASVVDAVELTKHAASVGADAALVLPPFFFKSPSARGLADYFWAVMDSADLPILLYNIPQFSAVPITNDLIDLLAGHPNLAGVKDSAGDLTRTLEFIKRYPELKIFAGSDRLAADCYSNGGAGCISGGANAFPEVVASVRNCFRSGGMAAAAEAQVRLNALLDITMRYPFITSARAIIANRSLPRLGVRPPLTLLPAEDEQKLVAELASAGFVL